MKNRFTGSKLTTNRKTLLSWIYQVQSSLSLFLFFRYFALTARHDCPFTSASSPSALFPRLFRFIPRTSNDVLVQWSVPWRFPLLCPSVSLPQRHLVFPFLLPTLRLSPLPSPSLLLISSATWPLCSLTFCCCPSN